MVDIGGLDEDEILHLENVIFSLFEIWPYRHYDEMCYELIFLLNVGYSYIHAADLIPEYLSRRLDVPYILYSTSFINKITGDPFDEVFLCLLKDNDFEGVLDDVLLLCDNNLALAQLDNDRHELLNKLSFNDEEHRKRECAGEIITQMFGQDIEKEVIMARINKCNDKSHRDVLYKLELNTGKRLSYLDSLDMIGITLAIINDISADCRIILSKREIDELQTVENLVDAIVLHTEFLDDFIKNIYNKRDYTPICENDSYDLMTRINEVEMRLNSRYDYSNIHNLEDLRIAEAGDDDFYNKFRHCIMTVTDIDPAEIIETATLDDLGLDSIDIIQVIMELEKELNIDIPDEEAAEIVGSTIANMINYIRNKTSISRL